MGFFQDFWQWLTGGGNSGTSSNSSSNTNTNTGRTREELERIQTVNEIEAAKKKKKTSSSRSSSQKKDEKGGDSATFSHLEEARRFLSGEKPLLELKLPSEKKEETQSSSPKLNLQPMTEQARVMKNLSTSTKGRTDQELEVLRGVEEVKSTSPEEWLRKGVSAVEDKYRNAGVGPIADDNKVDLENFDFRTQVSQQNMKQNADDMISQWDRLDDKVSAAEYLIQVYGITDKTRELVMGAFADASTEDKMKLLETAVYVTGQSKDVEEMQKAIMNAPDISLARSKPSAEAITERADRAVQRSLLNDYRTYDEQQKLIDKYIESGEYNAGDGYAFRATSGVSSWLTRLYDAGAMAITGWLNRGQEDDLSVGPQAHYEKWNDAEGLGDLVGMVGSDLLYDLFSMAGLPLELISKAFLDPQDVKTIEEKLLGVTKPFHDEIAYQQRIYESADIGGIQRFAQDVMGGVIEMVPAIVMSIVSPGAGLAVFGAGAGGASARQAYEQGASLEEAVKYGLSSGAMEIATEKLFTGFGMFGKGLLSDIGEKSGKRLLTDATKKVLDDSKFTNSMSARILKRVAASGGEATEEMIMEIITPYLERSTYNPDAMNASWEEIGYAGGLGAAIGAILGIPVMISETVDSSNQKKAYDRIVDDFRQKIFTGIDEALVSGTITPQEAEMRKAEVEDIISQKGSLNVPQSVSESKIAGEALDTVYDTYEEARDAMMEGAKNKSNGETVSANYIENGEVKTFTATVHGGVLGLGKSMVAGSRYQKLAKAKNIAEKSGYQLGVKEEIINEVSSLSKALGKEIEFVWNENQARHGAVQESTGKIVVNANSSQSPARAVIAHEVTHLMEGTDAYAKLYDLVKKSYGSSWESKLSEIKANYAAAGETLKGKKNGYEEAETELMAMFVEEKLLTDEAVVREIVQTDRSVAQKIIDWFNKIIQKLVGNKEQKVLADARALWQKALEEEKSGAVRAQAVEEGAVSDESVSESYERYSINVKTYDYAMKRTVEDDAVKIRMKVVMDSLKELSALQGYFNKNRIRNIHDINDYLKDNPDVWQKIIDIQNRSIEAGVVVNMITPIQDTQSIEGKLVQAGLIGIPIEYVDPPSESKSKKKYKFQAFNRRLPQFYFDSMNPASREEFRKEFVKAVEHAYEARIEWENPVKGMEEYLPGKTELKGVVNPARARTVESKNIKGLQPALRKAEKTIAALNLNSACPMFSVGNNGCYLDACYLTQMAMGANGVNLFKAAMYSGEILQLSQADINRINDRGGLRVNGIGDTIVENRNQFYDIIKHACMRGLKLKIITKQKPTLSILQEIHDAGYDISKATVQPSMDNLWIPATLDDIYGAGVRGTVGIADTVTKGTDSALNAAAEAYDSVFGRATKIVDGVLYRKYGFTPQQIAEMRREFPDVQVVPRYVVCTAKEIAELALNRNNEFVNNGKLIQTLMHGKVPEGCFSDYEGEIINFGAARHVVEKDPVTGKWDFYGMQVSKKNDHTRITSKTKTPHEKVKEYVEANYTAEEQDIIWTNLKEQMCCQDNEFSDACAGCQSLCAGGCSANQLTPAEEFDKQMRNKLAKENELKIPGMQRSVGVPDHRVSKMDVSYDALVSKPDMRIIKITKDVPLNEDGHIDRTELVKIARENIKSIRNDEYENMLVVRVDDIGRNVLVGREGIKHGIARSKATNPTAKATLNLGELLKESIVVNELLPRKDELYSYATISIAMDEKGLLYPVRSIINVTKKNLSYVSDIEVYDELYASRAKKIETSGAFEVTPFDNGSPSFRHDVSTISIKELLDIVKDCFPEILSEDVLDHYGMQRQKSSLEGVRYSIGSDSAYLDAVNRGDMATAQRMVDEAAKAAGYDSPKLYHGTRGFGFTKLRTSDLEDFDWSPFFATNDDRIAETYSGKTETRKISDSVVLNTDSISDKDLIDLVQKYINSEYELASEEDRTAAINAIRKDFRQIYDGIGEIVRKTNILRRNAYDFRVSANAVRAEVESMMKAETAKELEAAYKAYERAYDTLETEHRLSAKDSDVFMPGYIHSDVRELNRLLDNKVLYLRDIEGIAEEYLTPREARLKLNNQSGIYELYANTDNLFEIDAKGEYWNSIPGKHIEKDGTVNTRAVAKYANEKGYAGVLIRNLVDSGGQVSYFEPADIYIFFDPAAQVKSADAVTYDDNGDVIPPSERFNEGNKDIRWSVGSTKVDTELKDLIKAHNAAMRDVFHNRKRADHKALWNMIKDEVEHIVQTGAERRKVVDDIVRLAYNTGYINNASEGAESGENVWGKAIRIPEAYKGEVASLGGLNALNAQLRGSGLYFTYKKGNGGLDEAYSELQSANPMLPDTIDPAEQMEMIVELFKKNNTRRTLEELDEEAEVMGEDAPYLADIRNAVEAAMNDIATLARYNMMQVSRQKGIEIGKKQGRKAGIEEQQKRQLKTDRENLAVYDNLTKERTRDERKDAEATMRMHDELIEAVRKEEKALSREEKREIQRKVKAKEKEWNKELRKQATDFRKEKKKAEKVFTEQLREANKKGKSLQAKLNEQERNAYRDARRKEEQAIRAARLQAARDAYDRQNQASEGSAKQMYLENNSARKLVTQLRRDIITNLVESGKFVTNGKEFVMDENGAEIARFYRSNGGKQSYKKGDTVVVGGVKWNVSDVMEDGTYEIIRENGKIKVRKSGVTKLTDTAVVSLAEIHAGEFSDSENFGKVEWDVSFRKNKYTPSFGLTLLAKEEGMDVDRFYTIFSKMMGMVLERKNGKRVNTKADIENYIHSLNITSKQKHFLYFDVMKFPLETIPGKRKNTSPFVNGGRINEPAGNRRGRMLDALDNIGLDLFRAFESDATERRQIDPEAINAFVDAVYGKESSAEKEKFAFYFAGVIAEYAEKMEEIRTVGKSGLLTEKPEKEKDKSAVVKAYRDAKKLVIAEGEAYERMADKLNMPLLKARYYAAKRSTAIANEMIVGKGQRNIDGVEEGKSLKQIFDPVFSADKKAGNNKNMEALTELVNCRHDIYRLRNGKGFTGYTIEECERIVKRISEERPHLLKVANELADYGKNLLRMCVDSGLISEEGYQYFTTKYPYYVPTFRLRNNEYIDRKGNVVRRDSKIIRAAKGGNDAVLPLFDQLVRRTQEIVKACKKNQLATELALAYNKDSRSEYIVNITRSAVQEDKSAKKQDSLERMLTRIGEDEDIGYNRENGNIIAWHANGVKYDIEIADESLLFGWDRINYRMEEKAILTAMRKLNNVRRGVLTQYNPTFWLTNGIKDIQDMYLYNQHAQRLPKYHVLAAKTMFAGSFKDGANSEALQEYLSYGMSQSSIFEYDNISRGIKRTGNKVVGIVKKPFEAFDYLNFMVEQTPRLAVYMETVDRLTKEREASKTKDKLTDEEIKTIASYQASDATLNFGRSGTWVKNLNSYGCTFLNAGVQGMDRFRRMFTQIKDGNKKVIILNICGLVLKMGIIGMGWNLLTDWIYGGDDEYAEAFRKLLYGEDAEDAKREYEEMSDYQRTNYLLLKIGDKWIRIPKGRLASFIYGFAYYGERVYNKDIDILDAVVDQLELASETIMFSNPLTNNILGPMIDVWRNKDAWGNPIVSEYEDMGEGFHYLEYDEETTDLAVKLAEFGHYITADLMVREDSRLLDFSPKKLDYIIEQYLGSYANLVKPFLNKGTNIGDNAMDGAVSLIKKFYIDPTSNNRLAGDYYDLKEEYENIANAHDGDSPYAVAAKLFNEDTDQLKFLRDQIKVISGDTTISRKERLEEISRLREQMNLIYRQGTDAAEDLLAYAMENYTEGSDVDELYNTWIKENLSTEWREAHFNQTEMNKYNKLTEAGCSADTAVTVMDVLSELKPLDGESSVSNYQQVEAIAKLNLPAKEEEAALIAVFPEKQYAKYTSMTPYGVTAQIWLDYEDALAKADADNNGNGYYDNDEKKAAADSLSVSNSVRAVLWQSKDGKLGSTAYDTSWKAGRNPYGSETASKMIDSYMEKIAGMEEEESEQQYLPLSADYKISSEYGVDRGDHNHSGIDLAVPTGSEVYSVMSGTVSFAGWKGGYGYRVVVDHPDGTQTAYSHLSDIGVREGDDVEAGTTIALSGNTGNSTGPHLHFEVMESGEYVDPELYYDFGNGLKADGGGNYVSQMSAAQTGSSSRSYSSRSSGNSTSTTGSGSRRTTTEASTGNSSLRTMMEASARRNGSSGNVFSTGIYLPTASAPVTGRSTKASTYGQQGIYLPKASDYYNPNSRAASSLATTQRTGRTGGSFWNKDFLS